MVLNPFEERNAACKNISLNKDICHRSFERFFKTKTRGGKILRNFLDL